jgi:predicted enzyme related to lactoylglutathione lyase
MQRVRGIGGIFFKAQDPKALAAWYRDRRGVPLEDWGGAEFIADGGKTVWNTFKADTTYFAPSTAPFMINFRVDDLAAMIAQLRAAGENVIDTTEESEFGSFGWVMDPEGNKIELWQPPAA